ncbi:MAG: FecR domain-containing protein [Thermoplasmatales archaeon]|nr:MAG: FecR domain-containing protein [Thermoplasmatales archaeon]
MGKEAKKNLKNKTSNKQIKKKIEKKKIDSKKKTNFFKKQFRIIVPVIIIICLIVIVGFFLTPGVVADKAKAQLIINSGEVQIKSEGESWKSAESGIYLYSSDSVKTGNNSSASIILFETSIVRLDSNTQVTIGELVRDEETSVTIQQDSGRTWNTVYKISGIDNYEVQTPTTVASVRGTAFVVIVQENGSSYYGVSHGLLNISKITDGVIQESIEISENESVFIYIDVPKKKIKIKPLEKDEWIEENLISDDQFVEDLKDEFYDRIDDYISQIKAEYGISDQELDALIEGYILGYFDLPADTPKWIRELFEFS